MPLREDTFAKDRLPPLEELPEFLFELQEVQYPQRINCAKVLLDDALIEGFGDVVAIIGEAERLTFGDLDRRVNQICNVLRSEYELIPGTRVLLRGPNNPMLIATWLAVVKAGGIAVATMPLLRSIELAKIINKARVDIAVVDARFTEDVEAAADLTGLVGRRVAYGAGDLERLMDRHSVSFAPHDTAHDDVAILAFTSGTTGDPKATVHFHRDVLAMTDVVARGLLQTQPGDVYTGSPPLGFTFGLGALLAFPLRFRAATAPLESPSPERLLAHIGHTRATALFTAPTGFKAMLPHLEKFDLSSLRQCVSAGEHLPLATYEAWLERTGIRIIDGLGSTEMMHIFISAAGTEIRPGATGKALPGYRACVLDEKGRILPPDKPGRLAVKGPTGCRYLDDRRQRMYVQRGWNVTGDIGVMDADGYFWYQGRTDDMIVSAGYNISPVEVEQALMRHPSVMECAVVGAPDADRGSIVKAFVVLRPEWRADGGLSKQLQEFVKSTIAPYKYPRAVEFLPALPKNPTGKVQRFVLRERGTGGPGRKGTK